MSSDVRHVDERCLATERMIESELGALPVSSTCARGSVHVAGPAAETRGDLVVRVGVVRSITSTGRVARAASRAGLR
eukprot:408167-Prymnesium_polylepis.1